MNKRTEGSYAMKQYLLPENGTFYKANLHCHSTISDGKWTPEEIKARYMAEGYSIVAYTDHDIMIPHPELTDDGFLALTGYEVAFCDPDPALVNFNQKRNCHLCFIAPTPTDTKQVIWHRRFYHWGFKPEYIPLVNYDEESLDFVRDYTPECINRAIDYARRAGYFISYNHPAWSMESYPEYMAYEGFDALEVVNYGAVSAGYLDENLHVLVDMIRAGKHPFVTASDDNHNNRPDSFGGFTMVKAPSLTYGEVFDALMRGDCYASEGPLIEELWVEDGRVRVKTSPAASIVYYTDIRCTKIVEAAAGEAVAEASFEIGALEKTFFLVVRDEKGKFACTRAYDVKEIKEKENERKEA